MIVFEFVVLMRDEIGNFKIFEKFQKITKAVEKQKFDFSKGVTFFLTKFERSRLCPGASHNLFYSLKPKPQICEGSFSEKSSFKNWSQD